MISLYQIVKNFDVIYNRFDVVPVFWQSDGRTDKNPRSISRDKNDLRRQSNVWEKWGLAYLLTVLW